MVGHSKKRKKKTVETGRESQRQTTSIRGHDGGKKQRVKEITRQNNENVTEGRDNDGGERENEKEREVIRKRRLTRLGGRRSKVEVLIMDG